MEDKAVEWCQRYDEAEQRLLQIDGAELSDQDLAVKNDIEDMRNMMNHLKAELGLPHGPLEELVHKGLCPKCEKSVVPTEDGHCPKCGTVVIMPQIE